MKCIAIDDEPLSLELISRYAQATGWLEMVGSFTDALEGRAFLEKNKVDLLFLDIQMPDITGIQLFRSLDTKPMVIFTTAFSNYAAEGFDLDAVDYLVKPFDFDRFQRAVNKARELAEYRQNQNLESGYLFVKYDYQWNKIYFREIELIEALDDYIKIFLTGRQPVLIHLSMKSVMEKLPETQFLRVHRSFIVPIARIQRWNKNVLTIPGRDIPISITYQKQVMEVLDKGLNKGQG